MNFVLVSCLKTIPFRSVLSIYTLGNKRFIKMSSCPPTQNPDINASMSIRFPDRDKTVNLLPVEEKAECRTIGEMFQLACLFIFTCWFLHLHCLWQMCLLGTELPNTAALLVSILSWNIIRVIIQADYEVTWPLWRKSMWMNSAQGFKLFSRRMNRHCIGVVNTMQFTGFWKPNHTHFQGSPLHDCRLSSIHHAVCLFFSALHGLAAKNAFLFLPLRYCILHGCL